MAKCKNCKNLYYAEVIFKHGTTTMPCCFADGEEIENISEERECFDFECMTNADKIRSMTDEELAKVIMCPYERDYRDCKEGCWECCLRWLKSESVVEQ